MKMEKNETVASFFSRIAQLKEQLTNIVAVTEPDDFIGAAIDGLPDSWSSFIASISRRGKSPSFEEFLHECIEEEADFRGGMDPLVRLEKRILSCLPKFKKDKRSRSKKPQKDSNLAHIRCFGCDQLGHYAKDCKKFPPQGKRGSKSKRKKLHASVAVEEVVEDEQPQKRMTRYATREEKKECYLVSALSGPIIDVEHIWLIDSGASRHMTGFKDSISNV